MKKLLYIYIFSTLALHAMDNEPLTTLSPYIRQNISSIQNPIPSESKTDPTLSYYNEFPGLKDYNAPYNQRALIIDKALQIITNAVPAQSTNTYADMPSDFPTNCVFDYQFSCDGNQIAITADTKDATNQNIYIWDPVTGKPLLVLQDSARALWLSYHPHKATTLASSAQDSTIKLWDTQSGECLQTIGTISPLFITFSPDGETIAGYSSYQKNERDPQLYFINTSSQKAEGSFLIVKTWSVNSIAYSPDGSKLMLASLRGFCDTYDVKGRYSTLSAWFYINNDQLAYNPEGDKVIATKPGSEDITIFDMTQYNNIAKVLDSELPNWLFELLMKYAHSQTLEPQEIEQLKSLGFNTQTSSTKPHQKNCCCTIS